MTKLTKHEVVYVPTEDTNIERGVILLSKIRNEKSLVLQCKENVYVLTESEIRWQWIKLLMWLTDKNAKYAPMYGGTPELEKDLRFAGEEEDYTVEYVLDEFIKQNIEL